MAERLVHVEVGGQILCSTEKNRLGLLNCDWRNEEVMYDEITCPACIGAMKQHYEDEAQSDAT